MKDILTISERAAERIEHLMSLRPADAEPAVGIRIGGQERRLLRHVLHNGLCRGGSALAPR